MEMSLLHAVIDLCAQSSDAYGYSIARSISAERPAQALISHGTLYKALGRLTERGLLESRWEDAEQAEAEGRPRRRLYSITAAGIETVKSASRSDASTASSKSATAVPVFPSIPVLP
ncbi:Transcriptional regulator PadR-like family protein [Agreia pratensis]|uniref:Transcriptional regulator PadR-like family protein n=2 Tax=Agreia pratensis TaxID=150121 RepID=A0A1X7ISB8_9MICO|nr:Transcriptional regulator PadR-like family protein [Agreia pratensis]